MRIILFLLTNVAVLVVIGAVFQLLGLQRWLAPLHLNLPSLLIWSAVLGMSGSFISLALSKWMAKRAMGVQVIEHPANATEAWLLRTVEGLAQKAGIGMPEVGIFPAREPNAFATGMSRDAALVAVSVGLLETMREDEVEAVLGHEIAHVANGDMVTMGLLQGVVNTFVYFLAHVIGMVVDRALARSEEGRDYGYGPGFYLTQFLAQIFLSILASMVVMWFSRHREFRADAGGARLAGRERMIAALRALQRGHVAESLPGELAAFGISGGMNGGLRRLFMSHPPLEERIRALQRAG